MDCALIFFIGVILVIVILFAGGYRSRILAKLGLKNAMRRKVQIALVVAGLMIGTAMISGSLMMGDTLNYYFRKSVYDELYLVDEQISISSLDPEATYFPYAWFTSLKENVSDGGGVDGIAPRLHVYLPVRDARTLFGEASLSIIGIVPEDDKAFGIFRSTDGKELDGSELREWECYLTENSAEKMEAVKGDTLLIFYKGQSWNLTLREIIRNEGKVNSNALILKLETLQNLTGREGKINQIIVSNKGGVEDAVGYSDTVSQQLLEKINATIKAEDAGIYTGTPRPLYHVEECNNTTCVVTYMPLHLKSGFGVPSAYGIYTNFMDFGLPEFLRNVFVNLTSLGINMSVPVNTTAFHGDEIFGNYTDIFGNNVSDVGEGEIIVVNNFNINLTRNVNAILQFPLSVSIEYLAFPDYHPAKKNFTVKSLVLPEGRGNFMNATIIFNYTDAVQMFGIEENAYRIKSSEGRDLQAILENAVCNVPVVVRSEKNMFSPDFIDKTLEKISHFALEHNIEIANSTGIYTDVMSAQPYNLKTAFINYTLPDGSTIPMPLNIAGFRDGNPKLLDGRWEFHRLSEFQMNSTECIGVGMLASVGNTIEVRYLNILGGFGGEKLKMIAGLPGSGINTISNTTLILNYSTALRIYSLPNNSVNFIQFDGNFHTLEERNDFIVYLRSILDELTTSEAVSLHVDKVKADSIKSMEEAGKMISSIFLMLDGFTISAGIVLIILIFYLLAEERKSELGIARAVGMQRRQLIQMFLYEGIVYAILSALVGSIAGIGLGYAMIYLFTITMGSAIAGFEIVPHFELSSILVAFSLGLSITLLTILLAANNISRLNIVSAIRNIPQPKNGDTRTLKRLGVVGVVAGILFMVYALDMHRPSAGLFLVSGPFFLAFGCALLLVHKFGHERLFFSIASLITIVYLLIPIDIEVEGFGFDLFIATGIYIVVAGVLLLMYNSRIILNGLMSIVKKTRRKQLGAVMKIAILYPMNKKMRTATTIFMFALVIFSVTMLAMIAGMQMGRVNKMLENNSGGFDIFAFTNEDNPINNITKMIYENRNLSNFHFDYISSISSTYGFVYSDNMSEQNATPYQIWGLDDTFIQKNEYTFYAMAEGYQTPAQIWEAIRTNSSLAVVDKSLAYNEQNQQQRMFGGRPVLAVNVSEHLHIRNIHGQEAKVQVIGILNTDLISGIFTNEHFLASAFNITNKTVFAIALKERDQAGEVAKHLEKEFLSYGLRTIVLKDLLESIVSIASNIMNLMQVFLGLGLIVGIAGLAIVALRAVTERRREIGMLRALGFQKKMVLSSFIIETSYISLFGILLGVLLGIGVSYSVFLSAFAKEGVAFTIPVLNIVLIVSIAYMLTLLLTSYAAIKASKIPPAEALRYIE